jgi:hypothetical protein
MCHFRVGLLSNLGPVRVRFGDAILDLRRGSYIATLRKFLSTRTFELLKQLVDASLVMSRRSCRKRWKSF